MAKNVVITGATSGIGEAIARAYIEKGENIVLTDVEQKDSKL